MCFSAEASFGLSVALLSGGVYCVKNALSKNRLLLPVAIIPILFAVQQFSEGWVWIGLRWENAALVRMFALVFLAFAIVFWPFWVPFCAFVTGKRKEKIIFGFLSVLGLVIGLGVYGPLFISVDSPVADVINHAIHYNVSGSTTFQFVPVLLWEAMYIAIIASPLFASNSRKILYLGIAIVLSAAVSYLIFWFAFTSVWCFFAALLSLYLCIVFRNLPPLTFKQQNS